MGKKMSNRRLMIVTTLEKKDQDRSVFQGNRRPWIKKSPVRKTIALQLIASQKLREKLKRTIVNTKPARIERMKRSSRAGTERRSAKANPPNAMTKNCVCIKTRKNAPFNCVISARRVSRKNVYAALSGSPEKCVKKYKLPNARRIFQMTPAAKT